MKIASVDLRHEASAEVERVARARGFRRDGDERARDRLESGTTWIAIAKRTSLKRALEGRICLVYRVAFEDATGRVVASTLLPVLIGVSRAANRGSTLWLNRFLQEADAVLGVRVGAECEAWRREVVRTATAFASARLRRELASVDRQRRHDVTQPGLFDRRVQRWREAEAAAGAESERAASARVRAVHAAADLVAIAPRLMLVLTPWS